MRRHDQTSRGPTLFDLPLVVDPKIAHEADRAIPAKSDRLVEEGGRIALAQRLDREAAAAVLEAEQIDLPAEAPTILEERDERESTPLLRRRFQAGLVDSAVGAAALGLLVAGASRLGVPAGVRDWPAYLLAILVFSFFYVVFSLTFWRRTPGMARARLVACPTDGSPMTIGQAALRWLGGIATVALLGLPTLLALRDGRSLADYLSGSRLALDSQPG